MNRTVLIALVCSMLVAMSACSEDEVGGSSVGEDCESGSDCTTSVCIDGQCAEEGSCTDDEHCPDGICEDNTCVEPRGFAEPCDADSDCLSGLCVEFDDGQFCTEECEEHSDCGEDGDWLCRDDGDGGRICEPGPDLPPADGSTLCGAGGVSEGDGTRLIHCLAPYDQGSEDLEGEGTRLESGGFQLITE